MGKFAKWIGGGLGFTMLGPLGALIGFAIGAIFDEVQSQSVVYRNQNTASGDFAMSLLVLVAAVMKADGKILKSELNYVKAYLRQQFDEQSTLEALKILQGLLAKNIPVHDVSLQIAAQLDYPSKLQLLHFLYGISLADQHIHESELNLIDNIADWLTITRSDKESVKNMFIKNIDSNYKILEIDKSATNDEVKKAFRNMAMKFHPDKVNHLGEEFKQAAEIKFKMVKEAYDSIKMERGMN